MGIKTFTWNPEYSVGVQMIDEQHQHFFEIANRLALLAVAERIDKEELLYLFGELGNYALYHLSTEENLFNELHYPDAAEHIAAHDRYRDDVANRLSGEISAPNADVRAIVEQMAETSNIWLQGHILTLDKKYKEFFNEHGVR